VRLAAEGAAGSDVDHPATRAHVAHGAPRGVGGSYEVDVEGLAPGLLPCLVVDHVDGVREEDSGVVDEHVDTAQGRSCFVDHLTHLVGIS